MSTSLIANNDFDAFFDSIYGEAIERSVRVSDLGREFTSFDVDHELKYAKIFEKKAAPDGSDIGFIKDPSYDPFVHIHCKSGREVKAYPNQPEFISGTVLRSKPKEIDLKIQDYCKIFFSPSLDTRSSFLKTQVEVPLVNDLERGTLLRNCYGLFLSKFDLPDCLDFGSGESRYCDILRPVAHVEDNRLSSRCHFQGGGYKCNAFVTPILTIPNYKSVVCLNSLQNNSPFAISQLCFKWKNCKLLVVWPTKLGLDEVDPYNIIVNELYVIQVGFVDDIVVMPPGLVGRSKYCYCVPKDYLDSKYFGSALNASNFLPISDLNYSSRYVSAFIIGIYRKRIVSPMKKIHVHGKNKTVSSFDFLAGGKIEYGETVREGLLRECKEELVNFKGKPLYLGYSDVQSTNGRAHYYVHEFSSPDFPVTQEKGKVGVRGVVSIVEPSARLRDDMIPALRMLVANDYLEIGYAQSLECSWLEIDMKVIRDDTGQTVLYSYNKYSAESVMEKISPVHKYLYTSRVTENENFKRNKFCYYYVTSTPLKIGDIVAPSRSQFNGCNEIYYNGRLHVRFEMITIYLAKITEIIEEPLLDTSDLKDYVGGLFKMGKYIFYDYSSLGCQLFRLMNNRPKMSDDNIRKYFLAKAGRQKLRPDGTPIWSRKFK